MEVPSKLQPPKYGGNKRVVYSTETLELGQVVRMDTFIEHNERQYWNAIPLSAADLLIADYGVVIDLIDDHLSAVQTLTYQFQILPLRENVTGFCGIGGDDGTINQSGFGFYVCDGTDNGKMIKRVHRRWFGAGVSTSSSVSFNSQGMYSINATWLGRNIEIVWISDLHDNTKEPCPNIVSGQTVCFEYLTAFDPELTQQSFPFTQETSPVSCVFLGAREHLDYPIGTVAFFEHDYTMQGWTNQSNSTGITLQVPVNGVMQDVTIPPVFGNANGMAILRYPKKRVS